MAARKLGNIVSAKTVFFCCDMQERFRQAIQYFPDIVTCSERLVGDKNDILLTRIAKFLFVTSFRIF